MESVRENDDVPESVVNVLRSTAKEALEPWQRGISFEELVPFYEVQGEEEFRKLTTYFLKSPPELSEIAYEDPVTAIEMIGLFGEIKGLHNVSDIQDIAEIIRSSLDGLTAEERVLRLKEIKNDIEEVLASQIEQEDAIISSDSEEGRRLQNARIVRKRHVADGLDGTLFRYGANNGTIVNPSYLLDDTLYEALGDNEPEATEDDKTEFLRHMMGGHWGLGQDHTFFYRNSAEGMATAQTGVPPDYAAVRPGNFIFHDLKLLEHGPYKENFPTPVLSEYLRHHYLRQMDLGVLDGICYRIQRRQY